MDSTNSPQAKTCQNCRADFTIDAEDLNFYKKIDVPPPTFCPDCRLMRKMARRNERSLYKRKCDLCHQEIISMYEASAPYCVYCNDCWWGDGWDALESGMTFDPTRNFFEQFDELARKVPRVALFQKGNIASPYTNHADHNKNCYLAYNSGFIEDSMYCKWGIKSKDMLDCYGVHYSENVYECQDSERLSNCRNLCFCYDCVDCSYLYNCKNCQNCFLSTNLRNRKYVFANEQLSPEEYKKRLADIDLGSYQVSQAQAELFQKKIMPATIRKYGLIDKAVNSSGDNLYSCNNVKYCFHLSEAEDCAYCTDNLGLKDSYDTYEAGFACEQQYDCHASNRTSFSKFCSVCYDNHHLEYCEMCHGSSNLFGCIGLHNKQYCILNRQYSKSEYEDLIPRIKKQMSELPYFSPRPYPLNPIPYLYGEFFPVNHSPFAYNETVAQEYFNLSGIQALARGYRWKESDTKDYQAIHSAASLPDRIGETTDNIANEIIECAHAASGKTDCNHQCTTAFRVVPAELQFYRRWNISLPRLCPNCRHYERMGLRNPLKLWERKCAKCNIAIQTSYSPDRPEIVYCEACYNAEVA